MVESQLPNHTDCQQCVGCTAYAVWHIKIDDPIGGQKLVLAGVHAWVPAEQTKRSGLNTSPINFK